MLWLCDGGLISNSCQVNAMRLCKVDARLSLKRMDAKLMASWCGVHVGLRRSLKRSLMLSWCYIHAGLRLSLKRMHAKFMGSSCECHASAMRVLCGSYAGVMRMPWESITGGLHANCPWKLLAISWQSSGNH